MSTPAKIVSRALATLCLLPCLGLAQTADLRLPISLDADSTDYDGKSSMLMFRGLRLSQGNTNIEADIGRASKLDFNESDSADLTFRDTQLRLAVVEGSPATFELRRPASEENTYAQAGRLEYDLDAGVVEFSDEAVITEGGNQISSSFLVYNIREQSIKAQSSADGDEKVKITVVPETATDSGTQETTDEGDVAEEEPPQ